ncbi:MAG TPA: SIS domain-containing protein [Candidatus Limnocylindrales bacterium]|jgi:D-sedoheptulose 7-phosphate isomerase
MPAIRAGLAEHAAVAANLESVMAPLETVATTMCEALAAGGRVYTFGNGGSAADAQHLAAELIGRYQRTRRALPAASLAVDPSVVTCIANDFGYDEVFARQVAALAGPGDVVVGFTTSGRSPSAVAGLAAGREAGATTVLFAAGDGGEAAAHADLALLVPSETTPRIQEMHLLLLHLLSDAVDAWAAADAPVAGEEGGVAP